MSQKLELWGFICIFIFVAQLLKGST
jgi:hypothetical protein